MTEFLVTAWDWKPSVLIGCAALIITYARIVRFRFSGKAAAWMAGVLIIFIALVSPLDQLADTYLFSVHMAKHILFVLVAPALLLIGLPAAPLEPLAARSPGGRCREVSEHTGSRLERRRAGAMAFWHIPLVFNAALSNEPLHIVEHLSLLIGGTIFWWPILAPASTHGPTATGARGRCLSFHSMHGLYSASACLLPSHRNCSIPHTPSLSTRTAFSPPFEIVGGFHRRWINR